VARRRLIFNAFTMNAVAHVFQGLWAHPQSNQLDYSKLEPWVELARLLERARFDAIFFADVLGTHDAYGGNHDIAVRHALQVPNGDPSVLVSALAYATEHLGFAFTSSIMSDHPFTFARRLSTLDHLTNGRVGWNIVTSALHGTARNYGLGGLPSHEERYAWAEEYLDVVYKLWEGSWDDDAVLRDRDRGVYADPALIHAIDHVGERYRIAGPHLAEPSPQRTPVLFQAGSSRIGRAFAARHAEAVFIHAFDPGGATRNIEEVRQLALDAGRRADDLLFIQAITFVLGSTEEEASRRDRELNEWLSDEGMAAHVSGIIGVDLSEIDLDRPISDAEQIEGVQGVVRALAENASDRSLTFGELVKLQGSTRVVGTPEQIADELERWADAGVDGFNVCSVITPGTLEDFVEHAVPVLQDRGLMQREYAQGTLREKLFEGRGARLLDRHPAALRRIAAGSAA
jgi:FMN-dependent oxidoreductase (nitrilotriacetate monooxygenase family)